MEIKEITNLKKKKNKAIFLGCGSSIKNITHNKYKAIKEEYDIWVSNGFFMHKFIEPDFYHLEVNLNSFVELFSIYFNKSLARLSNSSFVIDKNQLHQLNYIKLPVKENIHVYHSYESVPSLTGYDVHPMFVRNSGSNLSKIVDIMIKMKYEEIAFAGVDLKNSLYFWSDQDNIPDIIKFSKPDENTIHCMHHSYLSTINFLKGISLFNKGKIQFFNFTKESLLNDKSFLNLKTRELF